MERRKNYKWCFVPQCANTTIKKPEKIFFTVPRDVNRRNAWFQAVQRDISKTSSTFYCCEDHFNLQIDAENYYYYSTMGGKIKFKLSVVPHIFKWQQDCKRASTPTKCLPQDTISTFINVTNGKNANCTQIIEEDIKQEADECDLLEDIEIHENIIDCEQENLSVKEENLSGIENTNEPFSYQEQNAYLKNEFLEYDNIPPAFEIVTVRGDCYNDENCKNETQTLDTELKITNDTSKHFKCDHCEYTCVTNLSLKHHKLKYSKEQPFKCDPCDYRVIAKKCKFGAERHKLKHSGKLSFKCNQYEHSSVSKYDLNRHKLQHSDKQMNENLTIKEENNLSVAEDTNELFCYQKQNIYLKNETKECDNTPPAFQIVNVKEEPRRTYR